MHFSTKFIVREFLEDLEQAGRQLLTGQGEPAVYRSNAIQAIKESVMLCNQLDEREKVLVDPNGTGQDGNHKVYH